LPETVDVSVAALPGAEVYLGAVVVLLAVMTQGLTERRSRELRALVGVSWRTLARWRVWWQESFASSPFWAAARAQLSSPVAPNKLPGALLDRFNGCPTGKLLALLRFIAPITGSQLRR
jgi:hypothetical protein